MENMNDDEKKIEIVNQEKEVKDNMAQIIGNSLANSCMIY